MSIGKIEIKTKEILSANCLRVSAGTNCPQLGDAGHGGRTYFELENCGGTAWAIGVDNREFLEAQKISICLGGDTECETFLEALKFAVKILEKQIKYRN